MGNDASGRRSRGASGLLPRLRAVLIVLIAGAIAGGCSNVPDTVRLDNGAPSSSGSAATQAPVNTVPWDYRIQEGTVGDLIGGDMTILPDNQLLPNDDNYATGDKIWTLQYMSAQIAEGPDGRSDVTLSTWTPIKSYKTKEAANRDLANLKISLKTEVELVGVYKTEYNGQTRQFAVLTLPSGQQVKQPVDEKRYASLKSAKRAAVLLEEVHDYQNYDMAFAKFRGWAA